MLLWQHSGKRAQGRIESVSLSEKPISWAVHACKLATASKNVALIISLASLSACSGINWTGMGTSAPATTVTGERHTSSSGALLTLGKSFAMQGEHNAAIPLFRSAYQKSGSSAEPLWQLGKSLMAVGRYDEALEALSAANSRQRRHQGVLLSLGQLYLATYEPSEASNYFSKAVEAGSRRGSSSALTAKAYSGLGIAYELSGNHQAAQSAFDSGLAIDNNNIDLLSNKALSLAISGQEEAAINILMTIVVRPEAESQHRQNLALAYAFQGDSVRAWQIASIDLTPDMAERAVAGFYTLKALDQENRMQSLVYGMATPRSDLERTANKRPLNPDGSEASKRIIGQKPEEPVVIEAEPEPVSVPSLPPLMDPSGWAVQIAAYRKPEEVIKGWEILSNRYEEIIGDLEPRRSEVSFGERQGQGPSGFYYRLNAGPLSGYRQSRDICTALIRAGGDCWIRPPEPSEGRLPK